MIAVDRRFSANVGSIGVHTRTGFQMIGTHPNVGFKFGRWLDTVMIAGARSARARRRFRSMTVRGTPG